MTFAFFIWLNIWGSILLNVVLWIVSFFPPKVIVVDRIHMRARGLALPGMIFIRKDEPPSTICHELTHIKQYRRYSPFGVSCILAWHYGLGFLKQKIRGEALCFWSLWVTNPLEKEANESMYIYEDKA